MGHPNIYVRISDSTILSWIYQQINMTLPVNNTPLLMCGGKNSGCCTPSTPCGIDDGDCDSDTDCKPGLICGSNNCPNKGVARNDVNFWDRSDDCCTHSVVGRMS